jgi:hypothetical protein
MSPQDMAVAADRNPWIASPGFDPPAEATPEDTFVSEYDGGSRRQQQVGNSMTHNQNGQNVLYNDNSVSFQDVPTCGINKDNIYTMWTKTSYDPRTEDAGDIVQGAADSEKPADPTSGDPDYDAGPMNTEDSVLVNDGAEL